MAISKYFHKRIRLFWLKSPHHSSLLVVGNGVCKSFNSVDIHTWIFWQDFRLLKGSHQPASDIYLVAMGVEQV